MALFGLITKNEYTALQNEINSLKSELRPFQEWQLRTAEAERYTLPDPSVYENQAELFRKLSWVLQSVDITAAAAALTPFSVSRLIQGKEPKDIPNHDFELLLKHPNELDSRFEFLYATVALYMLNGNAYWWLNCDGEYSPPEELWFIPPSKIIPIPDEKMFLRGYLYYPGTGAEILLQPHEIVHFKRFNPFSRFLGLSAIESIGVVARGDMAMQAWNTRLFGENNARLPGILTFEQMVSEPSWEKIKADTREAAKNRELLMLRGVGQGGVQWMQNAVSQKEMEFLAGREFTKQEIMNTLAPGLSTWLSENSTLANSTSNRAAFNELTLYPKHVLMAEKITNSILSRYSGRELIGKFEDVRISDKQMRLAEQQEYAKTHSINQINEKYYDSDELFDDERGELLPVQINAQSGGIQELPTPAQPAFQDKGKKTKEPEKEEKPEKDKQAQKSNEFVEALSKYERYAVRRIGKPLEFTSEILPTQMIKEIAIEAAACKSENEVHALFKKHKSFYAVKSDNADALVLVMDGLRKAIEKL